MLVLLLHKIIRILSAACELWLKIAILWYFVSPHPPLNNQISSQNSWQMTAFLWSNVIPPSSLLQVANNWYSLIRCYSSSLSIIRNSPSSRWLMIEILWSNVIPPTCLLSEFSKKQVANDWHYVIKCYFSSNLSVIGFSQRNRWLMFQILWFDVSLHPPLKN